MQKISYFHLVMALAAKGEVGKPESYWQDRRKESEAHYHEVKEMQRKGLLAKEGK